MSQSIEFNIAKVQQLIRDTEKKYRREPHCVQLLAVSKTRTAAMIRQAAAAGITEVGENYLQEALDKQAELTDLALNWHFIGPIQSNKTRSIAEHFDWVHSVDRLKIAQRLNEQRPDWLPPLNICLQINISAEASKSGLPLQDLDQLASQIATLPRLKLRGLMAIPKAGDNPELQQELQQKLQQELPRQAFARLSAAAKKMQQKYSTVDTLSMGMSNDMEVAIAEGATIVRIGSAIFGPRD